MKKLLLIWVMIMTVFSSLLAQNSVSLRQVTGQVTSSEDGAALPGVSVSLKGTARGTTTGADGSYKISVGDGAVLVFGFVGYKQQTISAGSQTAINVVLVTDASELNEVVVTALGLTRTKNSLPYAAQQIKGDELTRVRSGNAFQALSGKVAGLQITQGNSIGGSTNVVIRGTKSLTGNNQALFVVDGVPIDNSNKNSGNQTTGRGGYDYGNAAADINPDDIESMTVLKGAAATALYGSRASNGVIIGLFTFLSSSPNQNPLFVDIVTGGRQDYIAAKDLMDKLIGWNDPRKAAFFSKNNAGNYAGGVVGKSNTFVDFSRAGAKVIEAASPYILADYVETEFLRAEAKERGFSVAGSAESHYTNAITASILYWGGTAADAAAYVAQTDVAYATAAGDWKQKIGTQKWIALYNRPYEGWVEIRRLDQPKIATPINAKSGFPTRLSYPSTEQTLNGASYTAAASAIGGDVVTTKLFWDKN